LAHRCWQFSADILEFLKTYAAGPFVHSLHCRAPKNIDDSARYALGQLDQVFYKAAIDRRGRGSNGQEGKVSSNKPTQLIGLVPNG